MHWPGDAGWHMGGMGFWWLLAVAVLAVALWALLRAGPSRGGDRGGESPEAILKRRYASGEIDRETYERILADLRR